MICFNCGYKLSSENIKECNLCGMKTPQKCPDCDCPNPLMAKFCFSCGTEIVKKSVQSAIENIDFLSENRKNVAVVFADISGFTALSERMDPEEVRDIINECFRYITKPIYELEGTIDKYIGDCVMVLFGAKYSHSDDPRRAVLCALKMLSLIQEFSKERLLSRNLSLNLSIGISYGIVVTGSVGNYFDKDYTVMGDVVNTAQRLQTSAKEGTILVSNTIYEETKDLFHYTDIGDIFVKNKKKAVQCFQPKSAKAEHNSNIILFERDFEIGFMLSLYNNLKGSQCIELTGEAGIGKTSLINEFVSGLPESLMKIRVDCGATYQNRVNYVLSSLLHTIMNISMDDSSNAKKYRLLSYVYYLFTGYREEQVEKNANFLSIIMGLDRNNDFQNILNSMKYEDIEREFVNQLTIFFKELIKKHSFIFIIDGVQWADSNSLTLLSKLIKELAEVKTIFIFASRHTVNNATNENIENHHVLKLNRLSAEGTIAMTCQYLNCNSISNSFLEITSRITNGNPLYIKEFIAAVKRKEYYSIKEEMAYMDESRAMSLPVTIENIILANLTDLDNNTVDFLQVASVIGSEFNLSWTMDLLKVGNEIENALTESLRANIIAIKSVHTASGKIEKACVFNHDTTREVIYSSILNVKKYDIHKRIGEYIEQRYANDLDNYYEVLCENFEKAGLREKTELYFFKTALKQKNNFNFENSLAYFIRFLNYANINYEQGVNPKAVQAFIDMGCMYIIKSDYDKAFECLNKALEIAVLTDDIFTIRLMISDVYKEKALYDEALGIILEIELKIRVNSSIYGKLLQQKCSILRLQGNPKALQTAKKSEQILLKTKDYNNLSETMRQAAYIYFARGDIDSSLHYLNKAYGYAEKINSIGTMAKASGNLGIIYHSSGAVSKALEYFNKSIEISDKISDIQSVLSSKINLGILYMEKGVFNKAEVLLSEVSEAAPKLSLTYQFCLSLLNLGDLMYERGDFVHAAERYNKSLEIAQNHGLPCEEGINYIGLAKLEFKKSNDEAAIELLEKAYKIFNEVDEISYISDYFKYKCVYEIRKSNYEEALRYCEKSISASIEAKSGLKSLKAIRLKGIIMKLMGEYEKSLELYSESINSAVQLESNYEMAKGYFWKYSVYTYLQVVEKAETNLQEAKHAIEKVDQCKWTKLII
jgi:adenylate cyclase